MSLFVLILALVWLGVSYLVACLIALIYEEKNLVKGLIVLDLVMWSAAYYLIDQIDDVLNMHDKLSDLMFFVLYIIMLFGVMNRWIKKHDYFKA